MFRLLWLTDIHLNFVSLEKIQAFSSYILRQKPDAVVITGDISEAPELIVHLELLCFQLIDKKIKTYFVAGNHDYYRGSIEETRTRLKAEFPNNGDIVWLSNTNIVPLTEKTALVGHDGWYDGGYPEYGSFFQSKLEMSDYHVIKELRENSASKQMLYNKINELSEQNAEHIRLNLPAAFESFDTVYYATHVSPFAESSRAPNGAISDPDWMPTFCSKRAGEAFMEVMAKMPRDKQLIILCGHSHTKYVHFPANNIKCIVGGASYRSPIINDVFDVT
jgi:predicted phosphohydrolase